MSLSKLSGLLFLILIVTGSAYAQQPPYLRCDNVSESSVDSVMVVDVSAKPGDTVWVPIHVGTSPQVSGFKMILRYDTARLKYVPDPDPANTDSSFVYHTLAGRMQTVQTTVDGQYPQLIGTPQEIRVMQVQKSQNPFDTGALIVQYFYIPQDSLIPYVNLAPGAGTIFRMAFVLNAAVPHGQTARIWWHEVNEFYVDPETQTIFFADCRRTDMAAVIDDGTATLFPMTVGMDGFVTADSAPAPTIAEFVAEPPVIPNVSGQTLLTWSVGNVDSLAVSGRNFSFSTKSQFEHSALVQPGAVGTWPYILKAFNSSDSIFDTVQVTVQSGGGGGNTPPVVQQIIPNSIQVEPGQPVSFSVTATDVDGGVLTLRATGLPAGATFGTGGQVVGNAPLTGNFSWVPGQATAGNSFVISFQATDNQSATSTSVTVAINVTSVQGDFLFTTSAEGLSPVGGLRGAKNVFLPIDLVSTQFVYGIQFDIEYDGQFFELDSVITTDRTVPFDVYDDIGVSDGHVRIITLSTANDTIITGVTSTAILYAVFSIDSSATPGDYPIYLKNGRESNNPDPAEPALELVTDTGIIQVDRPGDVNLDKFIDVGDLVNIVAYIIGNFGLPPRQFDVADVIFNDTVNVIDLVGVINLAFGLPLAPSPPNGGPVVPHFAKVDFDYQDMFGGTSNVMAVKSELPEDVAGVELEIGYDPVTLKLGKPVLKQDAAGMALTYKDNGTGQLRILMHFTNPNRSQDLIRAGVANLVDIPIIAHEDLKSGDKSKLRLNRAAISTATASAVPVEGIDALLPETFELYQNYPNPFNPTTTISFSIGHIGGTPQVKLDVYNVLGQRVKNLLDARMVPGTHSVDWDGTNLEGQQVASGIYFYKLHVDEQSESRKMLLLK